MKFAYSGDLDTFRYKHDPIEYFAWLVPADFDKLETRILKYANYDMVWALKFEDNAEEFIKNIHTIVTVHKDNLKEVRFAFYSDEVLPSIIAQIKELGLKFFFLDKVHSWYQLEAFKENGVCDMYLTAEMGLSLEKASLVLHEAGIRIRVCPHIVQKQGEVDPLIGFYIPPDHIDLYEPYVDVMEIIFDGRSNPSVVYDIYAHQKKWFGKYDEIIADFHGNLNGQNLPDLFTERRLGCELKCLKGGKCNSCFTFDNLCKTLTEHNIYLSEEV